MNKKFIEIVIYTIILFSFGTGFLLIMSYVNGWDELARLYKTEDSPPVDSLKGQSGKIGGWSCKNALNIGILEQGIYLSANSFVAFFNMPPLLIPFLGMQLPMLDLINCSAFK